MPLIMYKLLSYLGVVYKKLPDNIFLVNVPIIKKNVICYLSGKMKINYIKIVLGDKVKLELDSSNLLKGRIISRLL